MGRFIILKTIISLLIALPAQGLQEEDRLNEYHTRGYQWPPREDEFQPNIPGFRKIFDRRFSQLRQIEDRGLRYNGYMTTIHAAITCKNFTEHGWGLTRAPQVRVNYHYEYEYEYEYEKDKLVLCEELFCEIKNTNNAKKEDHVLSWRGVLCRSVCTVVLYPCVYHI